MKRHTWTFKASLMPEDIVATMGIKKVRPTAASIFVTGEILIDRLCPSDLFAFDFANSRMPEPLFQRTEDTIRMTRFDPLEVWIAVGVEMLKDLVAEEAARFGIKDCPLTRLCFFESLFEYAGLFDTFVTYGGDGPEPGELYLNSLTMLGKTGFGGIDIASFFVHGADLESGRVYAPPLVLQQRDAVHAPAASGPTAEEMRFLVQLV